ASSPVAIPAIDIRTETRSPGSTAQGKTASLSDQPASETSVSDPEPEEIRMRRGSLLVDISRIIRLILVPADASARNLRTVAGSFADTPQISGCRQPEMQIRSADNSPSMAFKGIAPGSLLIPRYLFGGSLIAATPSNGRT